MAKTRMFAVRLPVEVHEELVRRANILGVTRGSLLVKILRDGLFCPTPIIVGEISAEALEGLLCDVEQEAGKICVVQVMPDKKSRE